MATFTTFGRAKLEKYLVLFGVGDLVSFSAIESGIENSNYFVTTSQEGGTREFVLTIMEDLSFSDLPFFNNILNHLFNFGLPVPAPRQTLDGMTSTIFCGKPSVLFPRLEGTHLVTSQPAHCFQIGKVLADIHGALATTRLNRPNPFDFNWMVRTLAEVEHLLRPEELQLLDHITNEYSEACELSLPAGVIHGDLFRDNALFSNEKLTGVIDFYHACNDYFVQDIAIIINDWCISPSGLVDHVRREKLIEGYESVRQLESEEKEFLPCFQRAAAARFSLTRLLTGNNGKFLKEPAEFLALARQLSSITGNG